MSRPKRWADAIGRAEGALGELAELVEEYQEWRDSLPENLEETPLAEKLDMVIDLGIEEALTIVQEASDIDLPLGFGRD